MAKLSVQEACDIALKCIGALSISEKNDPGPGRPTGTLLFVNAESAEHLRSLALVLASELSNPTPLPLYRVQGGVSKNDELPLMGLAKRTAVGSAAGETIYVTGFEELTVPQDSPIVLLVENFAAVRDQRTFAHLVDGEGQKLSLYWGSVLIAGIREGDTEGLDPGALSRGIYLDLEG